MNFLLQLAPLTSGLPVLLGFLLVIVVFLYLFNEWVNGRLGQLKGRIGKKKEEESSVRELGKYKGAIDRKVEINKQSYDVYKIEESKYLTNNPKIKISYFGPSKRLRHIVFNTNEYEYAKIPGTMAQDLVIVRVLGEYGITADKVRIKELMNERELYVGIIGRLEGQLGIQAKDSAVRKMRSRQIESATETSSSMKGQVRHDDQNTTTK